VKIVEKKSNEFPLSARAVEWLNKKLSETPGSKNSEKEPYGEKVTLVSERV